MKQFLYLRSLRRFSQAYADLKRMPNIKIINTGKYKASEHGFMHVRLKIENMIRRKIFR